MAFIDGFEELADELEGLAGSFESRRDRGQPRDPETGQFASPKGQFAPKSRIGQGISDAMTYVVDDARSGAANHVPIEDARTIDYMSRSWDNHALYATSDLVRYHEYGTSTRATDKSRATINAPGGDGYVIPLDGYDSLPFGPDAVAGMDELNFRYVVHPGVPGQHFMRDALRRNRGRIEDKVAERLDEVDLEF